MPRQAGESSLPSALDYLRVLRRRKWWLIGTVVLLTGAALGYSYSQRKTYTATAAILVQGIPSFESVNGVTPATLGPFDIPTQEQVLQSASIERAVARVLHTTPCKPVIGTVTNTDIITVAASSGVPKDASKCANATSDAYMSFRKSQVQNSLNAGVTALQGRLNGYQSTATSLARQLAGTTPGSPAADAIQAQEQALYQDIGIIQGEISQLQAEAASTSGAQIVSRATVPLHPSSPKKTRNTLAGFGAGVILGILICILVDSIDDSVRSREELESILGNIPVLGNVHNVSQWRSPNRSLLVSTASPQSAASESYRSLRTALKFVLLDKGVKTLLLTSSSMNEGKTVTTANLGVATARAGQQVLIVSGDLRRPRLGEFFDLDESTGLASVVLGSTSLGDAIRPVPGVKGLWFLGTGPTSPEPAEFLASASVAAVMEEAAERFDLILVDCPPVLPVSDSLAASQFCDGIVLVTRFGRTRRRQLRRTIETLETSSARIFGAVFNDVPERELGYERYGYSYGAPRHRKDKKGERAAAPAALSASQSGTE